MNKKQLIVAMAMCFSFLFCTYGYAQPVEQNIETYFKEADTKFTYNGKPIHPGLIEEFSGWISDSGTPITVSVDVAAAAESGKNEYSEDEVLVENGYIYHKKEGAADQFFYKWLGRLDNGLHVLEVGEGGGGSGIFGNIYFVRFDIGEGITSEGKKYKRLLMSIVRNYTLGDRDDGKVEVLKDKVIVGTSRYREKPVVLEFNK